MAARKKTNKKSRPKNKIGHKKLLQLLLKHDRIKVVFVDIYNPRRASRERIITANGSCVVRYPTQVEYECDSDGCVKYVDGRAAVKCVKFSRYQMSCFRDDIDFAMRLMKTKKARAELIVGALREHDAGEDILIKEVYVGNGFKRKIV